MPRADVVVIGAGLAGLTAAARLAEAGAAVTLVAKGHASTHWGAGGIDVAAPEGARTPGRGDRAAETNPDHPYAFLGADAGPAVTWLMDRLEASGLAYVGTLETPIRRVPTAIGGTRRVAIVPEAQSAAVRPWDPDEILVVAGPAGFKDFWPAAIADSLARESVWHGADRPARVVGVAVELAGLQDRNNLNALDLAHRFDDPRAPGRRPRPHRAGGQRRGRWPPGPRGAARRHRPRRPRGGVGGRPVGLPLDPFEIPLVPPSVPGIRLWRALRELIRASGGRIQVGENVTVSRSCAGGSSPSSWRRPRASTGSTRTRSSSRPAGSRAAGSSPPARDGWWSRCSASTWRHPTSTPGCCARRWTPRATRSRPPGSGPIPGCTRSTRRRASRPSPTRSSRGRCSPASERSASGAATGSRSRAAGGPPAS